MRIGSLVCTSFSARRFDGLRLESYHHVAMRERGVIEIGARMCTETRYMFGVVCSKIRGVCDDFDVVVNNKKPSFVDVFRFDAHIMWVCLIILRLILLPRLLVSKV